MARYAESIGSGNFVDGRHVAWPLTARPLSCAAIPLPEEEVQVSVQPAQEAGQACLDHLVPQAAPQGRRDDPLIQCMIARTSSMDVVSMMLIFNVSILVYA